MVCEAPDGAASSSELDDEASSSRRVAPVRFCGYLVTKCKHESMSVLLTHCTLGIIYTFKFNAEIAHDQFLSDLKVKIDKRTGKPWAVPVA